MSTANVAGVQVDTRHWIGGQRVAAGAAFTDRSPIDEQPLAEVARGGEAEVAAAVRAAGDAFGDWSATPPKDRADRLELNEGKEISLVPGLERLRREVFEVLDYDTVVVLDSHWHTTVEFVVAAQPVRAGLFTSDELPRGMCRIPYDWRVHPELARVHHRERLRPARLP
jgi:Aldehyde dehydrogenase family